MGRANRRGRVLGCLAGAALACCILGWTAAPAMAWRPGPELYGQGSRLNVPVTMADGTVLRADVYFPTNLNTGQPARGKFPVILTQTPYGKGSSAAASNFGDAGSQAGGLAGTNSYLIKRGYQQVVVDVRGTGASQGSWALFDPIQAKDGAAMVKWAAKLPHSSGRVGTLGASYLGINQLLTAGQLGKHSPLKAMFPIISSNDVYRDAAFDGGLVDLEFGGFFLGLTGGLNLVNPLIESLVESPSNQDVLEALTQHIGGLLAFHAALIADVETGGDKAYDGTFWRSRRPQSSLAKIVRNKVPAFLVGGWYDLFQRGEPLNYADFQNLLVKRGVGKQMTRRKSASGRYQLLMGPWYHVTAGDGLDMNRIEIRWFDRWLKGRRTGIDKTKTPLHLNPIGSARYIDTSHYPLKGVTPRTYYLKPGGGLDRNKPAAGDGSDNILFLLGLSSPCTRSAEQWSAGLLELVLTSAGLGHDPCAENNATAEVGPGVSTYTTAPMSKRTMLGGPIAASLYATSTTPDTELVVTVTDVAPDGTSKALTSGALLGSFRAVNRASSWKAADGHYTFPYHDYTRASQKDVPTGQVTRFDIEVRPTFAQLDTGHRLRIVVASGDAIHILPTPPQLQKLTGGVYAIQHNAAGPSSVELPLGSASNFSRTCSLCR